MTYYAWLAQQLNLLFQQKGLTREPAKITADTVRNGILRALRPEPITTQGSITRHGTSFGIERPV